MPISSPLISVRRSSACFRFSSRQSSRMMSRMFFSSERIRRVLGDLVEQLAVLAGQLFLLQVDQLAQRHPQDRVGLHRRERVGLAHAALALKDGEAVVAQARCIIAAGASMPIKPGLGLGLRLRRADDANDLVDVGQRQQQTFDRVLALPGLGEQELRAAANDRSPGGG